MQMSGHTHYQHISKKLYFFFKSNPQKFYAHNSEMQ